MKLSNKTVMACKIVTTLKNRSKHLRMQEIAEEIGENPKYIEVIIALLRKAGIIYSKRSRKGGYFLVKENLTLPGIIESIEED